MGERSSHREFIELFLQIPLGVESTYTMFRIIFVIPYTSIKAICKEYNGAPAEFLFE